MVAGNPSKGGTRFLAKLDDLRQQIDNIDDQLLKLINRRGLLAQKIGEEKRALSLATPRFLMVVRSSQSVITLTLPPKS